MYIGFEIFMIVIIRYFPNGLIDGDTRRTSRREIGDSLMCCLTHEDFPGGVGYCRRRGVHLIPVELNAAWRKTHPEFRANA